MILGTILIACVLALNIGLLYVALGGIGVELEGIRKVLERMSRD